MVQNRSNVHRQSNNDILCLYCYSIKHETFFLLTSLPLLTKDINIKRRCKMTQIIKEVKNRQTKEKSLKKLKVAAYCRVSTLNEEQELSYESQLSYYKELIRNKHNMELVGVYGDQGFSGLRADNRPEFQRLIQDCSKGKINLIMVKSISRFSRNSVDCQSYLNRLKDYSVQVLSLIHI